MGQKKKLRQFAEIKTFPNVKEVPYDEIYNRDHALKGKWREDVFRNQHPVILELGCGKGEYTVGLAMRNPTNNYIGVDIKGARMWRGAKTALENKLPNVNFLRTRIEFIPSFFTKGEVDEIWITFPDPQPKEKQIKKRLTSPDFLKKYQEFLKPGGILHLKTDARNLYDYTLEIIPGTGFEILTSTADLYTDLVKLKVTAEEKEVLSIPTHYEKLFSARGHKICYLKMTYVS